MMVITKYKFRQLSVDHTHTNDNVLNTQCWTIGGATIYFAHEI